MATTYRIVDFEGTDYEIAVGAGDWAKSHWILPDTEERELPAALRFIHVLYVASKRAGKADGSFEDFLDHFDEYEGGTPGKSTEPPAS